MHYIYTFRKKEANGRYFAIASNPKFMRRRRSTTWHRHKVEIFPYAIRKNVLFESHYSHMYSSTLLDPILPHVQSHRSGRSHLCIICKVEKERLLPTTPASERITLALIGAWHNSLDRMPAVILSISSVKVFLV